LIRDCRRPKTCTHPDSCTATKRLLITLVVAPIKAERREAQQARMFVIGSRLKRLGRT
jgi:hypothetical protein